MTGAQFLRILKHAVESDDERWQPYLREAFSQKENLPYFSLLFSKHITREIPSFHRTLYTHFTKKGFKAAAAPRGFAKSTITDLVILLWYVIHGKKHFIPLISDTYTQSAMFLDSIRNEIETNKLLAWLYPDLKGEVWQSDSIHIRGYDLENSKRTDSLIIAKGAGQKIRGLKFLQYRPDLIIIDDLENDELVRSPDRRLKLKKWLLEAVLPALSKEGDVIMIGTILHFDSLLKNIIDKKDEFSSWNTLLFKAIQDNNTSLWPQMHSVESLLDRRDNPQSKYYCGPLVFAQEYQNTPLDDGTRIIKPEWLEQRFNLLDMENAHRITNPEKSWVESTFKKIIAGVDPAISEKETADYFAMITIGIAHDGHVYILDYFRDRISDPLKQTNVIIDSFVKWNQDVIKIESVAYQAGLNQLVRRVGAERGIYVPVSAFKPDRDKVRRATMQSANFAGDLVHLRQDHPIFNDFYRELIEFPLGTHDDMLDAFMNAAEETVMHGKARVFTSKPAGF